MAVNLKNILVVDDDGHIREVVRFALEQALFNVIEAKDGSEALALFQQYEISLIVLDITMPGIDGLDVCKQIRKLSKVPIIFLSSRDDELDKVLGLELGADDYISKPFSPRELVARIKAVFRRLAPSESTTKTVSPSIVIHGQLSLNLHKHRCEYAGQEIILTVTEFAMLSVMACSPGRVFTRDQLVDAACGEDHVISDRTVDSHIRRIRKKLASANCDLVETVYGLGYRMRDD
ncbi:MAG: response regulator transcription factor [Deltaproteobacteria bacterium]|nr:response regulator transcription factor [Deltaproteobacteria bacterium]